MHFDVHNPKERSDNLVSDLHYQDFDDKIDIKTGTTGKLYLTKFDTVREIVSGYFSDIKFYYTRENFIWIIQGRFDLKIRYIFDN
jgi:hypothetical protein